MPENSPDIPADDEAAAAADLSSQSSDGKDGDLVVEFGSDFAEGEGYADLLDTWTY
jgi:hypothetical protein